MNKSRQAFTLVEIMIVVAIIALLTSLAIPNLLRAKISSNDAQAKAVLRTMSTASESFANENNGLYPTDSTSLTGATPPYIVIVDPCFTTKSGYDFTCTMAIGGYTFIATPVNVGGSGTTTYTMTTGGVLSP